ncbi:MAG TPA: VIT and VWA domain-containing protein, partial [Fimbriimonadaceae bacterium]|nr:VIT and VWA domain-containing protein [Fimbriimonadaceae bacterium]
MMLSTLVCGVALLAPTSGVSQDVEPGNLQILGKDGKPAGFCPLEGTKVEADIAGFGARVTVRQTYKNTLSTPIEAIYTFPLPANAAVDRMNMRIGNRLVQGEIKKRDEARRIYDAAKNAGMATALLDQERPNIFTQSVANITPGAKIEIEISYVQLLKFEEGEFEFSYPMVVGPRFTGTTPDPGKVTPPITPKGTRTGATIDLKVRIDAGAPITSLESELHEIDTEKTGPNRAEVTLTKKDEMPNRDFILRYGVSTNTVQSALLTSVDPKNGGFFTLILMPPKAPTPEQIAPREVIFVFDQSGSQSGFPIQKSRELTLKMIDTLRPGDTLNVMGFSSVLRPLWEAPRPNTPENRALAKKFVAEMEAGGGTMLNLAINAAMQPKADPKRLRLILFNTDGYVGDEFNILTSIQKHRQSARIFTFGIGNSVNRFLIDSMSAEGKGDSEIVTLQADTDKVVERLVRRTQSPILTNIEARFEGVAVADVLPNAIPDVFSEKPVILKGRYTQPGRGKIVVSGLLGDEPWTKEIPLNFPDGPMVQNLISDLRDDSEGGTVASIAEGGCVVEPQPTPTAPGETGSAIGTLWAREKIEQVMRSNWMAMYSNLPADQRTGSEKRTVQAVTELGLRFGLMTQYTSFVAVEKRVVNVGGKQVTVAVPVEMADGVSYEGIFDKEAESRMAFAAPMTLSGRSGGLGGGGFGGGG